MLGEPEELWLLASDAGYGFTVRLKELITDRRAGKTILNVPDNSHVLPPALVPSADSLVVAVSSEGKLLAFPVADVPEMPRGKGNKLYDIPSKKAAAREELVTGIAVVPPTGTLVIWAGDKQKILSWKDLKEYKGQRAQRGSVLPRGWPRKVDRLEAQLPPAPEAKG
jgi:topoisomerase IV subunit A